MYQQSWSTPQSGGGAGERRDILLHEISAVTVSAHAQTLSTRFTVRRRDINFHYGASLKRRYGGSLDGSRAVGIVCDRRAAAHRITAAVELGYWSTKPTPADRTSAVRPMFDITGLLWSRQNCRATWSSQVSWTEMHRSHITSGRAGKRHDFRRRSWGRCLAWDVKAISEGIG